MAIQASVAPRRASKRFFTYATIGVSTFCVDLALLSLFAYVLNINYIASAGAAFLVAISINYLFSRKYVFAGSLRTPLEGYVIFLIIASVGFLIVTGLMYAFVGRLGFGLIESRVVVAAVVGVWNYLMNLYVNFRIGREYRATL